MARFLALLTSLSPVHPAYFPGSQILSAKQGSALNGLAGFGTTQNWTMCYSSFTNVSNTPAVYHEQCDRHTKTLHVVINHVAGAPRIFGAFAEGSWRKAACCAVSANNTCGSDYCTDRTSAGDWLFGLGAAPAKFEPSGANSAFQFVVPDEWPKWGDGGYDLYMGGSGALGFIGSCYMGSTYAPNNICGGDGSWDWGETNMEVWYHASKSGHAVSAASAQRAAPIAAPTHHSCARNNASRFGPMGCAGKDDTAGHRCCRLNQQNWACREDTACNVCPFCCHDSLKDPHSCSVCVSQHCDENLARLGCSPAVNSSGCCPQAQQNASTTLKNVLLIGDSVTNGMSGVVAGMLRSVARVQKYIGNDAAGEAGCWAVGSASPMGEAIRWDVIHYNEGLHSLWPRVNTSAQLSTWAHQLTNFTRLIQRTQPQAILIYATMTPFMPQKYINPCRPHDPVLDPCNDVEAKNALAVRTVRAAGVTRINDLYSVVTHRCGQVFKNCSICDDESPPRYGHPAGRCGAHYASAGWELLANSTSRSILAALRSIHQPATAAV